MYKSNRYNVLAHEIAHCLAMREIAKQQHRPKAAVKYWNAKLRVLRQEFELEAQKRGIVASMREQPPLGLPISDDEDISIIP